MKVILRDKTASDEPFIYASWSNNQWYASNKPNNVKKAWFAEKHKEIKKALEQYQIAVACLDEDPSFIVGYVVIKDNHLEWIYTKKDFRAQKVEELLFSQLKKPKGEEHARKTSNTEDRKDSPDASDAN
jgi:hypothetical protein